MEFKTYRELACDVEKREASIASMVQLGHLGVAEKELQELQVLYAKYAKEIYRIKGMLKNRESTLYKLQNYTSNKMESIAFLQGIEQELDKEIEREV